MHIDIVKIYKNYFAEYEIALNFANKVWDKNMKVEGTGVYTINVINTEY